MSSLYPRGGIWWLKFRHPITGELRRESTGFRVGVAIDKRKAEELRAKKALDEVRIHQCERGEHWDRWVHAFIQKRYEQNPGSLVRYTNCWRMLRLFLHENRIAIPRQLTREHCLSYFAWRQKPDKREGKYFAGHNTALLEIKFLGTIVQEAVLRGFCVANPCRALRLKRGPVREKPAFDLGHFVVIRRNIAAMPEGKLKEFFSNSFEIARHHGCRLSATHLNPQTDVHDGLIQFHEKGGKLHVVPIHPALVPLFERLRADGRTETYVRPKSPSKLWHLFFRHIGLKAVHPNICFHGLRVTVSTELAVANVSLTKAMRYVGHASTTIHRIYQRLRPEHLDDLWESIYDRPTK